MAGRLAKSLAIAGLLACAPDCQARVLPRQEPVASVNSLSDETINLVKQRLGEVAHGR